MGVGAAAAVGVLREQLFARDAIGLDDLRRVGWIEMIHVPPFDQSSQACEMREPVVALPMT
jgi:hypothetical protein